MQRIVPVLKEALSLVGEALGRFTANHGAVYAGNMAFLGMLALFPFLIFVVTISGFFGQTESGQEAIRLILESLPPDVAITVKGPIDGILRNASGQVLTASILFALWTSASGIEAARAAVIRAYGARFRRPMWRQRLESLAIVVITAVLSLVAMSLLILGPTVIDFVDAYFKLSADAAARLDESWTLLQYAVSPLAIFIALWGIYFALSPRSRMARRYNVPGALLALAVWLATAGLFSSYLQYATRLDVTYGGLAGVLIAQIFFFVVSTGFILGAEINAAFSRRHGDDQGEDQDDDESDGEGEASA